MQNSMKFKGDVNVAVGASLAEILTFSAGSVLAMVLGNQNPGQIVDIEVQNTGANAFTDFRIQLQDHLEGEFYDYLLAADFVSPSNSNMLFSSSDPSILAGGAKAHITFRVNSAYAFKVLAKRTSATTATVMGNARVS
jgi:hypothetical protein